MKRQGLQQYAKELGRRGYLQDITRFKNLSIRQEEQIIGDLKCLPGHRTKMEKLMRYIRESTDVLQDSQVSRKGSVGKPRGSNPRVNPPPPEQRKSSKIKKILSPYQK